MFDVFLLDNNVPKSPLLLPFSVTLSVMHIFVLIGCKGARKGCTDTILWLCVMAVFAVFEQHSHVTLNNLVSRTYRDIIQHQSWSDGCSKWVTAVVTRQSFRLMWQEYRIFPPTQTMYSCHLKKQNRNFSVQVLLVTTCCLLALPVFFLFH